MNWFYAILLTLTGLTVGHSAYGQLWRTRTPITGPLAQHTVLLPSEFGYIVGGFRGIAEVNPHGELFAWNTFSNAVPAIFVRYVSERYEGDQRYFFLGSVRINGDFSISEFHPGQGMLYTQTFSDGTGTSAGKPFFFATSDTTIAILGGGFLRRIVHRPGQGFSVIDSVQLPFIDVSAAAFTGDGFCLAAPDGGISRIDAVGQPMWSADHGLKIVSLVFTGSDFVGTCQLTDSTAALVRLQENGDLTWVKPQSARSLYEVIVLPDGALAAAGQSANLQTTVQKNTASGELLWQQTYGPGIATHLLPTPDAGLIVAARTTMNRIECFLTDAAGLTAPQTTPPQRHARLSNDAVQLYIGENENSSNGTGGFFTYEFSLTESITDEYTILGATPWLGGYDPAGNLHISAADWSDMYVDFRPGLMEVPARDFNRVWSIKRREIDSLQRDLNVDGSIDQPVPRDILTWPARGNPNLRTTLNFEPMITSPDAFPAPFIDRNQDGIYNVYDGDLPKIKGDEFAWWVQTDSVVHMKSDGSPLLVDLYAQAYLFYCSESPLLSQSAFFEYDLVNRSAQPYTDALVGFWQDPNTSCYNDDYIGSLPSNDAFFVYNAQAVDSCLLSQGIAVSPVYSWQTTNSSLDHFIYGGGAFNSQLPVIYLEQPIQFYNFLSGHWPGGVPITIGGSGYNSGGGPTNYVFPGNPANAWEWSMCSMGLPPGDPFVLGSHGPVTWLPGDTMHFEITLGGHTDVELPCPDVESTLKPSLQQLRTWKNNGAFGRPATLPAIVPLAAGSATVLDATTIGATYLWSNGATTPQIMISSPGLYSVTITAAAGCPAVYSAEVVFPVGTVTPTDRLAAWTVFPNPTTDQLNLTWKDKTASGSRHIVLYDGLGRTVAALTTDQSTLTLNLAGQPAGAYRLALWQDGRWMGTRMVIKQ